LVVKVPLMSCSR